MTMHLPGAAISLHPHRISSIKAKLGLLRRADATFVNCRDFHAALGLGPASYTGWINALKARLGTASPKLVFDLVPGDKSGRKAHFLKLETAKYVAASTSTADASEVAFVLASPSF